MREVKWENRTLSELGNVSRGKSKHRPRNDSSLYGGDYPFIQTGDVKEANFYINDYSQTYNEKGLKQSKLWGKDTLCITIAANIAETAILSFPACFPDSIVGFVPFENVSDVRYMKYTLDNYKNEFQGKSKGATQDNLSVSKIDSQKLLVPEYNYQVEIASIISTYDDLIENNQNRIKILEEMAQRLYTEWFVKFKFPGHEDVKMVESGTEFGMIPEGWEVKTVKEVIERHPAGKRYSNKNALLEGSVPILDQGRSGLIGFHNDNPGCNASEDDPIIVFANHTCYQRLVFYPFSSIQNVLPYKAIDKNYDIVWLHYSTKDVISFNDYKGHWPEFLSKKLIVPKSDITKNYGEFTKPLLLKIKKLGELDIDLSNIRDLLIENLVTGKRLMKN